MKMNKTAITSDLASKENNQIQAEQQLYNLLFSGKISLKEYLEEVRRKERQHLN